MASTPYYYEDDIATLVTLEGRKLLGVAVVCHLGESNSDAFRVELFCGEGDAGEGPISLALGYHSGSILSVETPARLDPYDDMPDDTRHSLATIAPAQRFDVSSDDTFAPFIGQRILGLQILNQIWQHPDLPGLHMQPEGLVLRFGSEQHRWQGKLHRDLCIAVNDETFHVNQNPQGKREALSPGASAVAMHRLPWIGAHAATA